MFSTTPTMGTPLFSNSSIARVASIRAKSCGVETITAPAGLNFCSIVNWTSPVPGGRSTTTISALSQWPSSNWVSAPATIGPRQAIAWPGSSRLAIDSTGTPNALATGTSRLSWATGRCPSVPSNRACEGP